MFDWFLSFLINQSLMKNVMSFWHVRESKSVNIEDDVDLLKKKKIDETFFTFF